MLSPLALKESKTSSGRARLIARSALLSCCHTRYIVLPGRHSHLSTALLRSERTLKSGSDSLKDCPSAEMVRAPSGPTVIVVPSLPYLLIRSDRAEASSPKSWYVPLAAKGSTYVSRVRSGVNV